MKTKRSFLLILAILVMVSMMPASALAASKPGKVKTVKASSIADTYLTLKWSKVSGATKYKVYRSTKKASGYKCIKTTSSRAFKNTKLATGKTYYYKVRAGKKNRKEDGIRIIQRSGKSRNQTF